MRGRHLIAGFAAALLLGACGGDKTGPSDGDGTGGTGGTSFTATVSGDITKNLSGSAYYGDGDDGTTSGGFAVVMGLLDTNAPAWVGFGREQKGEPAVGKYPLFDSVDGETEPAATDFQAAAHFTNGDAEDDVCSATGGEVEITSSSSARVAGKFTATMTCVPMLHQIDGPTKSITVTGTFDSKKAVIPNPEF